MNKKNIPIFFIILLVLVLAFFSLIASNMISIPYITEERTVSHFLYISNISAGEEKSFLGENDTKDEIINMGFKITRINDTYIKERPALARAFENQGFTDIYHEDRDSIFPLKGTVLEYNDSLYLVSIGSY